MAADDTKQKSFIARPITDFGITEEGLDELIEAVNTMREHQQAAALYNAAHKKIDDAMPRGAVEERTRVQISDVAEIEVTPMTINRKQIPAKSIPSERRSLKLL